MDTRQPKTPLRRRGAWLLALVPLAMFALGFALAPLYSMICKAVGIQSASAAVAGARQPAAALEDRVVTVRFDTNVPSDLPWEFVADARRIEARPGAMQTMTFRVRNRSDRPLVGRAIPSVVPWQAERHFIKTECFCFRDQAIGPGESREMILRFQVAPSLPAEIDALTLSYTFLRHAAAAQIATADAALNPSEE
ncbi:MAG: cytochrome c oxidase assembly protein [Methylibium sp.]